MSSKPTPLPLGDTLRDLALLRAADLDLSAVLPPAVVSPAAAQRESRAGPAAAADKRSGEDQIVQQSVERSYAFANQARAVIRLLNRGDVDKEGARLEEVRAKLEDVLQALHEHKDTPA